MAIFSMALMMVMTIFFMTMVMVTPLMMVIPLMMIIILMMMIYLMLGGARRPLMTVRVLGALGPGEVGEEGEAWTLDTEVITELRSGSGERLVSS